MHRHVLFGLTLVACLLLAIGEFGRLNEVFVSTELQAFQKLGPNHGYALLIIAVVAGVMGFGAWSTGSQPAALAVAALGAVSVLIILLVDAPDTDVEGTIGRDFEDVTAQAASGFKVAAAGAVLLLFSGVLTAALRRQRPPA